MRQVNQRSDAANGKSRGAHAESDFGRRTRFGVSSWSLCRGVFVVIAALLVLKPSVTVAQTADDFFHGGALSYLSNNIPAALDVVTNGLQRFPNDEKLQKLYELLNQQQQQQQENQNQENQEQQDQQKQDQQQQGENQEQKPDEQQKKDEQKPQEDQKSGGDKSKPEEQKEGETQQAVPHQMTPEEAKQLLDAQKGEEQVLIFQPQGERKKRTKQLKDW